MYYFGCVYQPGHYLWTESYEKLWYGDLPDDFPEKWTFKDSWSSDPKRTYARESSIAPNPYGTQGICKTQHVEGWTSVSFPDRSVDGRPNCVSVFLERGTLSCTEMLVQAAVKFAHIIDRYEFELVPD